MYEHKRESRFTADVREAKSTSDNARTTGVYLNFTLLRETNVLNLCYLDYDL